MKSPPHLIPLPKGRGGFGVQYMRIKLSLAILSVTILSVSCAGKFDIFPEIGDNMSNPITLAVDQAKARLYINNSNYNVLYDDGSLHIVDLTDPANPTRVNYDVVPSFNGEMYLDTTNQLLYTPNRFSSTEQDRQDNLFSFNVNEASGDLFSKTDYPSKDDPYGIACCDAENRIYTASEEGYIDYYDLDDNLKRGTVNLTTDLDTGIEFPGEGATRIRIAGNANEWGVITNPREGGVWIIDLTEVGVSGAQPVKYLIADLEYPEGVQADGDYLYVVSQDYTTDPASFLLLVLDLSKLPTPDPNNLTKVLLYKDINSDMLIASIDLDVDDPRELFIIGTVAYVAHFDDDMLSVVDVGGCKRSPDFNPNDCKKVSSISVGDEPFGMESYASGGKTYLIVANSGANANSISIIDTSTRQIVGKYP